ncbi:MAG TPA: CHAT domain-containing protein, partial [Pyrinomonadaceae bacterium]|nr:CHAT domain-containing protein [Pyrinomonadaceae bacterium]
KNDYARAEELYRRALSIRERALGAEHEDVAASLNNLAAIRQALGDYEQAERLLRRARAVMEKALGAEHPTYATALGNLAQHYQSQGDLLRAEPLYRQALAVAEKALGPDHPNVALVLANTAHLLAERGDAARAEQLQRRALAIREKTFGPENPNVAHSLNGLALLLMERREYGEAERLLSRSLAASEKAYGPEHGEVATILDNLAALYYARGEHARAAPLITRAHAVREKIFGPASREVALSLGNLAALHSARGEYARAEELYRRSLATYERALGPRHPDVASALSNLSSEYLSLGDTARAVQAQQRAEEIREHHLSLMLTTGSEAQKRLYMATLAGSTDYTVFLHASAAPRDPQALRLALTTLLRRKGRVLDAMSDQMGALRRRLKPEDRAALDQLAAERARLAALSLGEPGKRTAAEIEAESGRIGAEVERLEAAVGARPVEARERPQAVTLEAVQAAIPGGAALVEFALYRPYNVKARARDDRWLPPRYAAYVVRRAGAPSWFDLGDAASLDKAVADLRAALTAASREDVRALARALDERLMRPARALAPDARHFFVSPDGALNLVPFAALVDEQDRYLVETHMITYLTSGRDLLRARVDGDRPPAQQQAAVVLADPAFDVGVIVKRLPAADGRRSADLASMQFARLPGAADEARAISSILTGARVLTDGEASEAALKQVSRPALLHIATHGFFLGDQGNAAGVAASRGLGLADALARPARGENPLLRSGLALSGANARRGGGGEDGILTALEAAGLDLWGTRLVTLSACNTAVGEVQNGDGVYGLRRALVLAGSESQLMSLWPVSDYATRDLMVEYYRRLQAG